MRINKKSLLALILVFSVFAAMLCGCEYITDGGSSENGNSQSAAGGNQQGSEDEQKIEKDALTDTYWLFITAYYAFLPDGKVKYVNDISGDYAEGTYKLDKDGSGVMNINGNETRIRLKDERLEIDTEWGFHGASFSTEEEFEKVYPD